MQAITGNTYPVRQKLHALGGKWDAEQKAWMVPDEKAEEARSIVAKGESAPASHSYSRCKVCGAKAGRYTRIYRSGECRDCYEERKMGY